MSTYSDLVAAVEAKLDGVSNIGATHAYARWANDWSAYLGQFKQTIGGTVQIRGWVVTLDDTDPIASEPGGFSQTRRTYNLLIYGVLGVDDSANTEATFLDLCEAVLDALEGEIDFSIAGVIDYSVSPPRMRRYDKARAFGSVLCHYCEIGLSVQVTKSLSYA